MDNNIILNILQILNDYAPLLQVVTLVIVAFLTWVYAHATRASVSEMEKQRRLASQPWVFPKLVFNEGQTVHPSIHFENVGNGPAIKLKPFIIQGNESELQAKWTDQFRPSNFERIHPFTFLKAGSSILWQYGYPESLTSNAAAIIGVEYQDIYGDIFQSGYVHEVRSVRPGDISLNPITPLFPVKVKGRKQQ